MARPPYDNRVRLRTLQRQPAGSRARLHDEAPRSHMHGCIWIIGIVMLVLGFGMFYAYNTVFSALGRISSARDVRPVAADSGPPPELLQEPFNVLVIGVDLRDDHPPADDVRADTLIVAHIDPLERWVSLLSIPRDTRADLHAACGDDPKINGAYACGYKHPEIYGSGVNPEDSGAALAAETVENLLGIEIDYTAQVNFDGFERLIDTMGGLTIDVPRTILDAEYPTDDFGYMRLYIPAGLQRLDGETALRYARTRHVDNDFGRAKRQQQVLKAMLDNVKRQGLLEHFESTPELLDVLSQSIRTTLPLNNISTLRGLADMAQNLPAEHIQQFVLKPEYYPDGSSNLLSDLSSDLEWDPAYLERVVQDFQSPPQTVARQSATIQVQNSTETGDVAVQLTTDLDSHGFQTVPAARAAVQNVPKTVILDYTGDQTAAKQVASFLGIDEQYVRDASDESPPPDVDIVVLLGTDYATTFGERNTN